MRSLIDTTDLSTEELDGLIRVALDMIQSPGDYRDACARKKLATLFFEPSTRTRMSFESAMYELGGQVLSLAGVENSSAAKGESIADTARVISSYADIIAMRHPKDGAALVAAAHSLVPVINAGDGGHFHPTQTLTDLLTIYREKGTFNGLTVGFCGDLKYGRTVHSLLSALTRYSGLRFLLISPRELSLPEHIRKDTERKQFSCEAVSSLEEAISSLDILYMTRIQRERFEDPSEYERLKDSYILTPKKMERARKDCCVLHPLPRVNEISVAVDDDPRACYFKQVENGKHIRKALILKLLGEAAAEPGKNLLDLGEAVEGYFCTNPRCITGVEQELPQRFYRTGEGLRCRYCDFTPVKRF